MSVVESSRRASRSAELDGLRGVAIALVLWHHLGASALPFGADSWLGWVRAASSLAGAGVDLFFVLSGYFIGGILIDHRESPRLARVFYLRRALRILPLYAVTLAVIFTLVALGAPGSWQEFPAWIYGLFLTNFALAWAQHWDWLPLSVLWSLAVEEQFYLLAPWIVRALSPTLLPWFAGAVVLTAWLLRLSVLVWFPQGHFG
ncbi:MAG: acyltransferase, partial [Verrucomicrobia bacterium]|nr:acyltransferase [Verrucomicrobiota bacterium]